MKPPPFKFSLLPRKKNTDKSHYGHALIIAGSRAMSGAPQLVSRACLSSGAGLVTVGLPKSVLGAFSKRSLAEIMLLPLPETPNGTLSAKAYSKITSFVKARSITCVAIGCGLSHEKSVSSLVRRLVKTLEVPVILDADGLNAYRSEAGELKKHRAPIVLTPHRKEFERLFSKKWPEKTRSRVALAKKLSVSYDLTLVLKSHHTLVAQKNKVYENHTGNPGMAKGGSGDVLTGIIAAFIAQGLDLFKAASWGVYFHGLAGDLAAKDKNELSLLPSDIIAHLHGAFSRAGKKTVTP